MMPGGCSALVLIGGRIGWVGAEGKNIANIVVYGKRAIVGFVCKGKS